MTSFFPQPPGSSTTGNHMSDMSDSRTVHAAINNKENSESVSVKIQYEHKTPFHV